MRAFLIAILILLLSAVCAAQVFVDVETAHAPHYPPIALAEGAAEEIKVNVVVSEDGKVLDARAASGVNSFLKSESERTAKEWVFSKSSAAKRETTLYFDFIVLYPPRNAEPDVEFSTPSKVTVRKHQPETSGPSR